MKRMFFCAAVASVAASSLCAADMPNTARSMYAILEAMHVSHRAPDDMISRRAWTNLLDSCDSFRMTFLSSDIARFAQSETKLDDLLRAGDFSFSRDVRRTYLKRLEERTAFATNMLAKATFDFKEGGEWVVDRKDAAWPADVAAADALWAARLKGETLTMYLSCETGGVRAAASRISRRLVNALERERERSAESADYDFIMAVAAAYDAHTRYLTPALSNSLSAEMSLKMCGVGAGWIPDDDGFILKRILPGSPLEKDGRLSVGDKIVAVSPKADGKFLSVAGLDEIEIVSLLFGKKGEPVSFDVEHRDGRSGIYTVKRDVMKLEGDSASSAAFQANGGTKLGYLRLQSFYVTAPTKPGESFRSSGEDVAAELRKLAEKKVGGVLLDLRSNGGGSLHDAVKIIGLFSRGGPAVRMKGNAGEVTLDAVLGDTACETPLVVLVDRMSASASELVSATLQDLGRAVVVGDRRTVGKGTSQAGIDLAAAGVALTPEGVKLAKSNGESPKAAGVPFAAGEGTALITNGRFYRITGASTQERGVAADIVLPSVVIEDIREENLRYALPWDEIGPLAFERAWDLDRYVPELRAASERRRAASGAWKEHDRLVGISERRAARKTMALGIDARRAQLADEKAIEAEVIRMDFDGFNAEKRSSDLVLDEALNILADLVRLNGGRTLPAGRQKAQSTEHLFDSLDDDD